MFKPFQTIFFLFFIWLFAGTALASDLYDYLLLGGTVYDGVHPEPQQADVGIKDGLIQDIGNLSERTARQKINVKGLIVQPGIIDAHTHSDFTPFIDPTFQHALRQGITTVVVGNCGMSAFPVTSKNEKEAREVWSREGVEMPEGYLAKDFSEYQARLFSRPCSVNLASLQGHGNLRNEVIGFQSRPATSKEIGDQIWFFADLLRQGIFGISFGLTYLPDIYANYEELVRLAQVVQKKGGVVTVHLRSEGRRLEESVEEVLSLARDSGATCIISHFKAAGKANWEKFYPVLHKIRKARAEGLKIYITVYPYTAAQTELASLLPNWFYSASNRSQLLKDSAAQERLKRELGARNFQAGGLIISVLHNPKNKIWEGKTIGDFAKEKGLDGFGGLFRLLEEEDFRISVFAFGQNGEYVQTALKEEFAIPVSDTIAETSSHPHPRAFGAFPLYFRSLALDSPLLPLGEAIRKVTSLPARIYKIANRGELRPGAAADVMVWDPVAYRAVSSYENSRQYAEGVRYLFVNGTPAIFNGEMTDRLSGSVLVRGN